MELKNKKIITMLIICVMLFTAAGCSKSGENQDNNINDVEETKEGQQTIFKMESLCSGDAKLIGSNTVVTGVGGKLTFIQNGMVVKQYDEYSVYWLDVISDEGLIVYSNWDKQVCILRYDDEFNILSNDVCFEIQEDLGIDPAVCKVENEYYITVTHITGRINNGDINGENGKYTINLYKSSNLTEWKKVSDVITLDNNLEDVDLNFFNEKLYITYEKETADKCESSINLLISSDGGVTFEENKTLVKENADNEPASIFYINGDYYLFYSSDIENKGESYEKAAMYMQCYDDDFSVKDEPVRLSCKYGDGILLYDVIWENDDLYCLFAGNYVTQNNLVLERLNTAGR